MNDEIWIIECMEIRETWICFFAYSEHLYNIVMTQTGSELFQVDLKYEDGNGSTISAGHWKRNLMHRSELYLTANDCARIIEIKAFT